MKDPPPTIAANVEAICEICREETRTLAPKPPTQLCTHPSKVCIECLRTLVNGKLNDGLIPACPTLECRKEFHYSDVYALASPEVFEHYDRRMLLAALQRKPNFVSCIKSDCNSGQFHPWRRKKPRVKCHNCGAEQCFTHQIPWHEGMNCAEWDQNTERTRRLDEEYSRRLMEAKTRRCPDCGTRILKEEGCDLVVCVCGFKFCWACGSPYMPILRKGNHHHARTCRHYRPKNEGKRSDVRFWEFWRVHWWRRARWRS